METWLLGRCDRCPDGERTGRITILSSLARSIDGDYIVTDLGRELKEELGPHQTVFWQQSPPHYQDVTGSFVRFRCERTLNHGDATTTKDWHRVRRSGNGWDVHRIGYRLIEQGPELEWRQNPRWVRGLTEGEQLFIDDRANDSLIGPWRVGHEIASDLPARELVPSSPNKVYSYQTKAIGSDSFYTASFPTRGYHQNVEILIYPPEESAGRPVDIATPKQLAKWLVDQVVEVAPRFAPSFDREVPGWRSQIRSKIEQHVGDTERDLYRCRWERLERALDDFEFEAASVDKLLKSPQFEARFDGLLRSRLDAQIAARAEEIGTAARREFREESERLEREIGDLDRRYQDALARHDESARSHQTRIDELTEREARVQSLTTHLTESRERLVKDLALYQLLPGAVAPPAAPEAATPSRSVPSGPAIVEIAAFIDQRLWPALARWYPGVPRVMAEFLHAAARGAKAVVVPSPAWARAYADAMGAANFTIVNVQPTWLGFDDLWHGGFGRCWERATRETDTLEIVLLRDFNRALPQCYARPLLDAVAGFAAELPHPGRGDWPGNFRLFACPAAADEALPLTNEVVRHFAAIQPSIPAASPDRPGAEVDGHVPLEAWLAWRRAVAMTTTNPAVSSEFGPLAVAAMSEIADIADLLRSLGKGEREATKCAIELRVSDPAEYVDRAAPEDAR